MENEKLKDCALCAKGCNCIEDCNCDVDCGCNDCTGFDEYDYDDHDYVVETVYMLEHVNNFKFEVLNPDLTFGNATISQFRKAGKWVLLYFYPADFSSVCQTEVEHMISIAGSLEKHNTVVIGMSTDKLYSHKAWVESKKWKLNHLLGSDSTLEISEYFNVLMPNGSALRGTFFIAPDGTLQGADYKAPHVGRDFSAVERDLLAAQAAYAGELVPCNWKPGQKTME